MEVLDGEFGVGWPYTSPSVIIALYSVKTGGDSIFRSFE